MAEPDVESYPLLEAIFRQPHAALLDAVKARLDEGHNPDDGTSYGELPLTIAFRRGRHDVIALLLEHGADAAPLGWSALHRAVALGSLAEVEALIPGGDLSARDAFGLTPFLVAVGAGYTEKAAVLLAVSGVEDRYRLRNRDPALLVAAEKNGVRMVEWLLANGFDVNEAAEYGETALMVAAGVGNERLVKRLLAAGARVDGANNISAYLRGGMPDEKNGGRDDTLSTVANVTESAPVARLLIAAGVALEEFDGEILRALTGADLIPEQDVTPEIFDAQKRRWFGKANPERVAPTFWLEAIRTGERARQFASQFSSGDVERALGPIWCHERFGMSTTELPDGRWVQVAGEHEDHYDADFCIYSDVFVFDGKGGVEIYIYPREVFPPTDFHSATLVGNEIILIGCLGYPEDRRPGETQVMRLSLDDFSISPMKTSGASPGWINRHKARLDKGRIVVSGGQIQTTDDYVDNESVFALDLASGVWERQA